MRKIGNDEISKLAENYADFWAKKDDKQNWMQVRSAFRNGMLESIKLLQNQNSLEQTEAGWQFLKTSQTKENQQSDEQLLLKHAVNISVCECEEPKFSQYIDFCLNCGLPPREDEQTVL